MGDSCTFYPGPKAIGYDTNYKEQAIDYKKLLIRCMEQWLDSEGCCWDGEHDKTLTNEEKEVIAKIYEKLNPEYQARVENNELPEDYDERNKKIKRNKKQIMNWKSPRETKITKDGSTLHEIEFENPNSPASKYIIHGNRYRTDSQFSKEIQKKQPWAHALIKWDYDSCNLGGFESIDIHITEIDDEEFLLEGLRDKTKEALEIMDSRLKILREKKCKND